MTSIQQSIIDGLSREIEAQAHSCAAEQYLPTRDADSMDEFIATRKNTVRELRRIREQLEELFTGVIIG